MTESTERTPLLDAKSKLGKAVSKFKAVRAFGNDTVNMFGDLTGKTPDGSLDGIGAGVALRTTAYKCLHPQDQIEHMRTINPKAVKAAIAEAHEASGQKHWASLSSEDVAREHGSTLAGGLAATKVRELWDTVGRNELAKGKSTPFIILWLMQFKDITNVIVLCAGLINLIALNDRMAGGIMTAYFFVSTFVNAIGEYSGAEGLSALNAMGAEACKVVRDGAEVEVPATDLVPGDIVHIQIGDTVPADMRVAIATDLRIDESVLTGETEEVTKVEGALSGEDVETFPVNMMYSSTAVVAGKGIGIVTATGMNAQVGMIAKRLDVGPAGLSPLQMTMNRLGGSVGVVVITVTVLVTLLCFLRRVQDPDKPCDEDDTKCFFWNSLARGLILGISCVPMTMPMMTTMLLNGARKNIQEKMAIVRKTSSIETLGCCMCICSDKTGTLTEGKMTVVKAFTPRTGIDNSSDVSFSFWPTAGSDPAGSIFKASELSEEGRKEIDEDIKKNGRVTESLQLRQYGTTEVHKDIDDAHVRTLMMAASLNSYATEIQKEEGKWVTVGNLSEGALVVGAAKAGIGAPVEGLELLDMRNKFPADEEVEVPFNSARKMMATVHAVSGGSFAGLTLGPGETHICIVKGAPDRLLPLVQRSLAPAGSSLSIAQGFDPKMKEVVEKENLAMAQDALRVLLLCVRTLTETEVTTLRQLDADARMSMLTQQLAIVGAFGILDPPRATVKASIERCKSAGVRVVMITGDQPPTAAAIGEALGIVSDKSQAKLCTALHDKDGALLPEGEIDQMVRETNVWARAQPADKVTIVETLQRMGLPTAMTGDGVNDAPALKLADIGTAMGLTGTAVAKGAADIVLMNDDFTTIVDAIQEGRRTYANVQLYVSYYMAMFLPEIMTYCCSLLSGTPMPLSSIQILGVASISHIIPPLMFATQPISPDAMNVPPRRKDSKLVPRSSLLWLVLPWLLIWVSCWSSCSVYAYYKHTGMVYSSDMAKFEEYHGKVNLPADKDALTEKQYFADIRMGKMSLIDTSKMTMTPQTLHLGSKVARSMNFVAVCVAELLLVLTFSSEQSFGVFTTPNKPMLLSCVGMLACAIGIGIYSPLILPIWTEMTGLVPLAADDLAIALAFAFGATLLLEVLKLGYMSEVRATNELRRYHALATSKGLLPADATDDQVEEFRAQHPLDSLKVMV
jgi:magnesium-transporting ATPase (P-type)